jgi:hypothetical protein
MQWGSTFAQRAIAPGSRYPVTIYQQDRPAAGYTGGLTYQRQWNRARVRALPGQPGHGRQRGDPLPLSSVRFSPKLDDVHSAPAGRLFDIPLEVRRQPNAPAGGLRRVTVQVSYDDGTTWRPAFVRGSGSHRIATVRHPSTAGFASLKVSAADTTGETVTQTVIRAYAID